MRGPVRWVMKGMAFAGIALIFLAALSWVVMLLWNALVPGLFGAPPLRFLQAAGLLVLSRILFGGLRGRHGPWRHHGWRQRWEGLTPEERERLRERYGRHCRWRAAEDGGENIQA